MTQFVTHTFAQRIMKMLCLLKNKSTSNTVPAFIFGDTVNVFGLSALNVKLFLFGHKP